MAPGEQDAVPQREKSFARVLSPGEVFLLTISALSPVVSVFIGGNAILHLAGTGAALGFIGGGLLAATMALMFAELAASFPGAGGVYAALAKILGDRWTYPFVLLRALIMFPLIAFSAVGAAPYIRLFLPWLPQDLAALGMLGISALIASSQIRRGAQVIAVFLVVELLALAVLTGAAIVHLKSANLGLVLSPVMAVGQDSLRAAPPVNLALAVITGAFMAAGADWATYFAEDMRDARLRMGPVVGWTGLIAALLIAVPAVLMVLAIDDTAATLVADAPMAHFLDRTTSPFVSSLVSLGIIAALFNSVIAIMMALSRQLHAMGRDGAFPPVLNRILQIVHARTRAPTGALIVLLVVGGLCTLLGERVLVLIVSGNFADYLLPAIALLAGRRAGMMTMHFRVWLHPLVPVVGLLLSVSILSAGLADADSGRISAGLLVAVFVAAFLWHDLAKWLGRVPVRLSGSEIE